MTGAAVVHGLPTAGVFVRLRPRAARLGWLRVAGCVAATAVLDAVSLWPAHSDQAYVVADFLPPLVFLVAGLFFSNDVALRANAGLFFWAAGLWIANNFGSYTWKPFPFVSWVVSGVPFVPLAVLLLRYPEDLLRRKERLFVYCFAGWFVGGRLLEALVWHPDGISRMEGSWWPDIARGRFQRYYSGLTWVETAGLAVLGLVAIVLVAMRLRQLMTLDRQEFVPVASASLVVVIVGLLQVFTWQLATDFWVQRDLDFASNYILTAIPLAFCLAALRRRLARGKVAGLLLQLSQSSQPVDVRGALRTVLGDPTLQLWYWSPETEHYVDGAGHEQDHLVAGRDRFEVPVLDADDRPIAMVLTDPALRRHRDLVDAAVTAGGFAVQNARLQATVLEQLEEVRDSQRRIVHAAVNERKRVERDLHDGAQQRIVALMMNLGAAQHQSLDATTAALIGNARSELRGALQDLRDLASGSHPSVLAEAGLGAAVSVLADRSGAPVQVNILDARWPAELESVAYFVVSEALANVAKHAPSSTAVVWIEQVDAWLRVRVSDDGPGGVDVTLGTGLRGLRDRVEAFGGRLVVQSHDRGSVLSAWLPCG